MLGVLLAIVLLLLLNPQDASGTNSKEEVYTTRLVAVRAPLNPITDRQPISKHTQYRAARATYNCVAHLRLKGFDVPRTLNGYAGSIPVRTQEISEGEVKIAVTREGTYGHVVAVQLQNGVLVSVEEGNHSEGVGRTVPWEVLKGFI